MKLATIFMLVLLGGTAIANAETVVVQETKTVLIENTPGLPLTCSPGLNPGPGHFSLPSSLTLGIARRVFPEALVNDLYYTDGSDGNRCASLPGEFKAQLPASATLTRIVTEQCFNQSSGAEIERHESVSGTIGTFDFYSSAELISRTRLPSGTCPN